MGDAVVAELANRFGQDAFRAGSDPDEVAIFEAAHSEVGDVSVRDDGDEITVSIGTITHSHFNEFDLPIERAATVVAQQVSDFLEALFTDRVVLWKSRTSLAGGWEWLDDEVKPAPRWGCKTYTWHGPVP